MQVLECHRECFCLYGMARAIGRASSLGVMKEVGDEVFADNFAWDTRALYVRLQFSQESNHDA